MRMEVVEHLLLVRGTAILGMLPQFLTLLCMFRKQPWRPQNALTWEIEDKSTAMGQGSDKRQECEGLPRPIELFLGLCNRVEVIKSWFTDGMSRDTTTLQTRRAFVLDSQLWVSSQRKLNAM